MHQERIRLQVVKNKYREWFEIAEQLNKLCAEKGFHTFDVMAPSTGVMNAVELVTNYDSLSAWETDSAAFQTDGDCMALLRKMGEFTDGYPIVELWESATQIA